jgi:HlyD family secretion protein
LIGILIPSNQDYYYNVGLKFGKVTMKRRYIIIIILVIVIAGGAFGYYRFNQARTAQSSQYQTQVLTKGALTSIIGATGTVRANQTSLLSWQTSGRISKINVNEGDKVNKGDVLAELDPLTLPQTIILAQSDLVNAKRSLENLKDSDTAKAQAELALANAQNALDDAVKKRSYKDYQRASGGTLDTARANYTLANNAYKTAKDNFDSVAGASDDSPIKASALSALGAAQLNRDKALASLNWLLGKPDPVEIAQADGAVVVAKAQLADAQREWDRLKNGVDPQDLAAAQAKVDSIEATLAYTTLTSPFDGVVTDITPKVGDQVSPGTQSFRIDDLSSLQVDVQVPEVDINKVEVTQPAQLTFDAIPNKNYNGKVIQVSKVGLTVSGVVNYTVTVALTNEDKDVLTGMTTAVNIIVKQLDNVLLVPNRAVKRLNGNTYIYILQNNKPVQTEIQLGAYSDTNSEVASGDVKAGDLLVLNPPVTPVRPAGGPGGPGGG